MSISGVVVRTRGSELTELAARLAALPGVEVHHLEASTGRIVITIETGCQGEEAAQLERVRRETGVLAVELVYHYVEPPCAEAGLDARREQGSV